MAKEKQYNVVCRYNTYNTNGEVLETGTSLFTLNSKTFKRVLRRINRFKSSTNITENEKTVQLLHTNNSMQIL